MLSTGESQHARKGVGREEDKQGANAGILRPYIHTTLDLVTELKPYSMLKRVLKLKSVWVDVSAFVLNWESFKFKDLRPGNFLDTFV